MPNIPVTHLQEELSLAYLAAVCAKAGAVYLPPRKDYGIDAKITLVNKRSKPGGKFRYYSQTGAIDIQLKASKNWKEALGFIQYKLNADNYNDMVCNLYSRCQPLFLFLYCLPSDANEWLGLTESELIMRKCLYWFICKESRLELGKGFVNIDIPKDNILTPEALRELFEINEKMRRDGYEP